MNKPISIVWFRRDLRLHDNPAWNAAITAELPILPIYLHCPYEDGIWRRGDASNWWLHHALDDLSEQLKERGHYLILLQPSDSLSGFTELLEQYDVANVFWNRCYEPAAIKRDTKVKAAFQKRSINAQSFNGSLLFDPLKISNKSGLPFRVFTPFWKHCSSEFLPLPQDETAVAKGSSQLTKHVDSLELSALQLLPTIPWDSEMQKAWNPTRAGGLELLKQSVAKSKHYLTTRDTPSSDGTSRLSPYLHFGQISPVEFHHHVITHSDVPEISQKGILRQLFWREFSAHLLFHFPHTHDEALRKEFEAFPWEIDEELLRKWQRGETGYPLIDAGMRQLWKTGWMHNRVRMVTASFLVKHLLQPWQEGAHWFWDTLVDADLPNNTMGWQWVGGCGADASPYFRVFNPILQSKKFDPKGDYIRKWIPELSKLPDSQIHTPSELEPLELISYGVKLGVDYPHPIISHEAGRKRALDAYKAFKSS